MSAKRPPLPDDAHGPRRLRTLSEDERVLWHSVAKQAKPLRKKAPAVKLLAAIVEQVPEKAAPASKLGSRLKLSKPALDAPKIAPPLAPLSRRERASLSRGKKAIEARIDLHGMTQHHAHRALLSFLQHANADGLRFVLVITGKGRTVGPESERGILRRQVPLWLSLPEFRMLVIGYEEAGIGHGGGGALYVRMRRMR